VAHEDFSLCPIQTDLRAAEFFWANSLFPNYYTGIIAACSQPFTVEAKANTVDCETMAAVDLTLLLDDISVVGSACLVMWDALV
jgi:hypothetical protein